MLRLRSLLATPALTLRLALALTLALGSAPRAADAAVWGYIDADGAPHVATERLDDRYRIFYKGRTNADLPPPPAAVAVPDDALRETAIFKRMAGHPNIARYQALIERNARLHGLDVALVKAVIAVESAYDPAAVSAKGALGLMQVIPDTGARYGVAADSKRTLEQKLLDPEINVRIGTAYLSDLLVLFADDASLALAAYNAGEQTVLRYANRIPPYPETRGYVTLVRQFQAFYAPPPPPPPPPAPAKPSRLRVTPSRDPS